LLPEAESICGQVDILINNGGITRDGLMMRMKDEDWQLVQMVNLESAFRLCRAAIKTMMKRRSGRIINMASVVGVTGNPGQSNYCASKAGLIGMTKSLAQEVASRGITVNAIAPGFIASNMTDVLNEEQTDRIKLKIPQGAMGVPQDIANGALYLASDEAGYVTGQTLHINGGMVMP
jgi:3-oxoacyl-[acyl-carrier protein] reductase